MSRWTPHGWVVVPYGPDGRPVGRALWCVDGDAVERAMAEERRLGSDSYYMWMYRDESPQVAASIGESEQGEQ